MITPYLGTTGSVLSGTTGDQLSVLRHEFLVESHVLLLGENGIVVLETVLLEKSGITRIVCQQLNWLKFIPKVNPYPGAWMSRGLLAIYSIFLYRRNAHTKERVLQAQEWVTLRSSHCEDNWMERITERVCE